MNWLRNTLNQIQANLSGLNASTKMLIGMCVIFMVATLGLVALYAGRADMAPLIDQAVTATDRANITSYLDMRGIHYEVRGDRVFVPVDRRIDVLAALQTNQMLPDDTSNGFANLVNQQKWWQSSSQGQMHFDIALQNELGAIVSEMRGIDSASVIISRPMKNGFSATHKSPSAAVNVIPGAERINQKTAEAIAGLVAGAVAEMEPTDVTVIDARAGKQFRPRDDDDFVPGDLLELVQSQERVYRDKISEALGYIPKVIVAVTVEVDPSSKQSQSTEYSNDSSVSLITRERSKASEGNEPLPGGEPGARSNTGLDIAGAGNASRTQTTEENEKEFEPHAGVTHMTSMEPGGVPTRISATVNIPRSFFVALFNQGKEEPAEPTDDELQPIIDVQIPRIEKQVKNLVDLADNGRVVVDVYPDASAGLALAGVAGATGGGGIMAGPLPRMLGLGSLALVSLLAMFMMLRKSTEQSTEVPSAVELAGLPPDLTAEDEVAGEAGSVEGVLTGIELDDDQISSRKVNEQVAQMVKENPDDAAQLLKRWVREQD